jgi:LmbE family N-acetylglucosaminyl deacetylase
MFSIRSRRPGAAPVPTDIHDAFGVAPGAPWLVVSPHDDDAALGCGIAIQAAQAAGSAVHIAVVTDGRMGYGEPSERAELVARRDRELVASSALLGIPDERLHRLGFPDGATARWAGTHDEAQGPRGIGRSLCALIRRIRPALILAPTPADLHPDHRVSTAEAEIACFHANAGIWHELGAPVAVPALAHYAVYCPFDREPTVRIASDEAAFQTKLAAVTAYASQPAIIHALVANLRAAGAIECFAARPWPAYAPRGYDHLFGVA